MIPKKENLPIKENEKKPIPSTVIVTGLGIAAALLFIMVLIFNQNTAFARAQAFTAESKYNRMNIDNKDLQKALDAVDSDIIFRIDSVYNSGNDQYSDGALVASEIRYLYIDYTLYWLKEVGDFAVYCDIYQPDGTLKHNPSTSPEGHTFAFNESFVSGRPGDSVTGAMGWGQKDESSYTSGYYTILIWYGDQVVAGRRVYIMPERQTMAPSEKPTEASTNTYDSGSKPASNSNTCSHCGGSGFCKCVDGRCEHCYGDGAIDCNRCMGSGNCQRCYGLGYTSSYAVGKGVVEKTCSSCRGSGSCSSCSGAGNKTCSYCNGSGECQYCHGSAQCQYCNGTGKIY